MSNKKISELPYINGGEISGNTLVPLVTYFSAVTGDTVHTYVSDLQNYLTSGITVSGNYLPLSGGTVTGGTVFQSGLTANTISATTYYNLPVSAVTNGTGISATISNGHVIITNTSPDKVVTISGGTGITTGGTYPNFTLVNSAPDQVVTITGGTNIQIAGTYPNFGVNFTGTTGSNFTGGTVTGATNFTNGLTANTISATTYNNLPISGITNGTGITSTTSNGNVTITNTAPDQTVTISGGTGITTGGTYPNFTLVNSAPDQTVTISGGTGITTGGTYPNFTLVNSAPDQTVTITGGTNVQIAGTYPNFGVNFTGQTSFPYLPLSGGTVTGGTIFTNGLTANTISATTYLNLPVSTDVFVTGGTYSNGDATFTNNTGGTFNVNGFYTGDTTTISYADLITLINNSGLTVSMSYLINDFATVYDQPDYFIDNLTKGTVVTKTGNTEPIVVFASSNNTLYSEAYQPAYPNDIIKYDYTFSNTEYNGTPSFGRISERIDEYNNRTDYDHRNVEFIRYQIYNKNLLLSGAIQDFDCTTGVVSGVSTLFLTEVTVGDVLIFDTISTFGYDVGVRVSAITDDTTILVDVDSNYTGTIFTTQTFSFYSSTATGRYYKHKEEYIGQNILYSDYIEYETFQIKSEIINHGYATSINNYIGDYASFFNVAGNTFYLSNNVIGEDSFSNKFDSTTFSNIFGNRFINNKIGSVCYENIIGGRSEDNIINSYLTNNVIGAEFSNNKIDTNFSNNVIDGRFFYNRIKNNFYNNNIGLYFNNNVIGDDFNGNIIGIYFSSNTIGNYFGNGGFYVIGTVQNIIGDYFMYNKIGNFFGNDMNFPFLGQGTSEDGGNIISNYFLYNVIGDNFIYNGANDEVSYNEIGDECWFNYFGNQSKHNVIGNLFVGNNGSSGYPSPMGRLNSNNFGNFTAFNAIDGILINNSFGDYFGNAGANINTITADMSNNMIGNYFGDDGTHLNGGNTIIATTNQNTIKNYFIKNSVYVGLVNNIIGNNFINNTITDDGLGSGSFTNCFVGNDFVDNRTSGHFIYNKVCDDLSGNDFTLATHVYGSYNTNIYIRPDGNYRLQYYDNGDALQIVTINS